jgi:hypothetical protein
MEKIKLVKGDLVKHLTNKDLIEVCLADGWKLEEKAKPKAKKPAKKEEK